MPSLSMRERSVLGLMPRICSDCVSFLNTYKKTTAVTKSVKQSDIPAHMRDNILTFLRKRSRRIGVLVIYILTQSVT
jgi:hypothetical protein